MNSLTFHYIRYIAQYSYQINKQLTSISKFLSRKKNYHDYSRSCFRGILMTKAERSIVTTEVQFAYKRKQSTAMWSSLLKDTVNHYLNRSSEVYACLVDASKAFDRLRYDQLLEILLHRKSIPRSHSVHVSCSARPLPSLTRACTYRVSQKFLNQPIIKFTLASINDE